MERQEDHQGRDDADDRAISTLVLPPPPGQGQRQQDTYIVQFPKDQVYHVPPRENALIAEKYRNPTKPKKRECNCGCFSPRVLITTAIIIISILAIVGITLATLFLIYKPTKPKFEVTHISVKTVRGGKNSPPPPPQYEITLTAHNRNKKLGLQYANNADISMTTFENTKVARGTWFPALKQEKGNSTEVNINLTGTSERLHRALEKSKNVTLDLDMKLWVKMTTVRMKTGPLESKIACKIMVSNLGNGTKILSQDCGTQIKIG
ncbi:hypothetical protein HN51_037084 [Arachis hypogaea]|uniref:NDR1/HIN1-like protein 13 n=1 Tax=Arachis hypogaea TaxID=3818 RepID=UPI000A2B6367|nr:NDR1/HIN1-like protein 13 isoform X1 [Arachis ipaensis]XP_020975057.1 NDR1/HIN1-like protein 13 isoform X2 [Arachis ipaensis]XP_025638024.1 NDR1/HIN1-like protein 13 [Arachis hypogaea]QHO02584.1 uncharacterized protein DS421_13g425040 [Arachis hypogaea]